MDETVTSAYIHSHLRSSEQEILKRPLYYGGDLTDNTYQDWILTRGKRFFLILVATGVPEQIFGVLDDCLDDDDLPIAEEAVPSLRLSFEPDKALDKRFYKTQFRYLTRVIEDGEHIRYADEENVPVIPLGLKSVIPSLNRDGVDTVKLASDAHKVFIRRKVALNSKTTEEQVLSEIAEMKKFSHEHVISVFGSYLQSGTMTVLSFPAPEYTLKSFLTDTPKAFETLDKSERRRILINWPHCLANALAYLHQNSGHHGAIRPSNIHINQQWQVSLGQLDGEGILCSSVKADDLEAYTYHPPERWKRAVTVQSTGSAKVALPSGGRSARKAHPEEQDPLDPSSRKRSGSSSGGNPAALTAYAFLPASKSEFARFRLSTAVDATALIPPPPRKQKNAASGDSNSTNSRGTGRAPSDWAHLARAPSVLSSNSSEGRRRNKHPDGIFLAAPESRTAVVQTWKSVQHDSFAADVFSLAAVIMEILTVLCKKSCSSFARHRSAKNRNAGRGGGLADASFHANLGQVASWAQTLAAEAEKKVKKDDSQVLRAVGAVLQVTVQCLERKPESRLKSDVFEEKIGEHIKKFANIDPLHCVLERVRQPTNTMHYDHPTLEPSLMPSSSTRYNRSRSRNRQESIPEDEELSTRPSTSLSNATRPNTSRTVMPTTSPPAVSLRSMPSMNIDMDGRSERSERSGTVLGSTVVGSLPPSRDQSLRTYRRGPDREMTSREIQAWQVSDFSPHKPDRFEYAHDNDSEVDPSLRLSTDTNRPGVFTYMNYSPTESEEEEAAPFMYPLPPQKRPPNRELPAVPQKSSGQIGRPHIVSQASLPLRARQVLSPPPDIPRGPSRDEIDMLQKLSRGIPGGQRPARVSSRNPLQRGQEEDNQVYAPELYAPRYPTVPRASSPHRAQREPQRETQRERVYRARAWNQM